MDLKEIKSCLKAAREAIRNKEFKEALKQCKIVLGMDKNNYNALVFIGVAAEGLEQFDQSLKAYRRAAQESPEQLLAWQGLATMLEKHPELVQMDEKEKIYNQLVALNVSEVSKQIPYLQKLIDLHVKAKNVDQALERMTQVLTCNPAIDMKGNTQRQMVDILSPLAPKFDGNKRQMYETALKDVLEAGEQLSPEDFEHYICLSLQFTSQIDSDHILAAASELRHKFPNSVSPLEFLLYCYLDQEIGNGSPSAEICTCIKEVSDKLKSGKPESIIVKVAEAFISLQAREFLKAQDILQGIKENSISGLYYLSQVYINLHVYDKCVDICQKAMRLCDSPASILCTPRTDVINFLKLAEIEAHKEIGTPESRAAALALIEEVEDVMPTEAFLIKSYIKLDEGHVEEAKTCALYLPQEANAVKTLMAAIHMQTQELLKACQILQEVTSDDPSDASATLQLGKILWEMRASSDEDNITQKCFTTLLKAAKLDPYNYESYLYLGYFYREIHEDLGKSRRCFQKAYDLSRGKDVPGCALVDALTDLGEESLALTILQEATSKAVAGTAKWAWLRLGLYQVKHEDPSTAIVSFQSALRADPNDNHVWECLAEAYLQRGSFTASLKAFTRAAELDPESLYSPYQIANIKHILGSLTEAIQDYKQILMKSENYVPVLKGIADSYVQLAKQNINHCLDGLAQDCCEEAIAYLTRAASQRPDLSCLWKTLGEACTVVHCLASDSFRVPAKLVEKSAQNSEVRTVNKAQLFEIGTRCFSQAVKVLPDSGSLWQDLGVSLYHQSQHMVEKDPPASRSLLQRASQALRKALSLEPRDWRHWNVMGVIACSKVDEKPAFAQHCFIKSLECESTNVVAWTNLGTLYFSRSEIQLAHDAFKSAQSVDPTYVACWIGQALIAEIVGHEEAMDLFRHTTELGVHLEGALGYGQWVLSTLGDPNKHNSDFFHYCIQQMAAVPAACDALVRYTCRVETDPVAFNMLGLLLEHQNLLHPACDAFTKAAALLGESRDGTRQNEISLNLARILCKQGKHEEALELFSRCDLSKSLQSLCMYGLVLYKSDKLMESFKVYENALDLASTDREKSEVYAALGMVTYKFDDVAGAKSQLFNSFQTSSPCPGGLYALCALGLLQQDLTLVSASLQELDKLTDDDHLRPVSLLQLYSKLLQNDLASGEAFLREVIEAHPNQSCIRSLLINFILQLGCHDNGTFLNRLLADQGDKELEKDANSWTLETLTQLSAGFHSRLDHQKNAIKSAQKAFHAQPGSLSSLCTMASAVHAEAVIDIAFKGSSSQLLSLEHSLLDMALNRDDMTVELKKWCLKGSAINRVLTGDKEGAQTYCKHLEKIQDCSEFATSLEKYLSNEEEIENLDPSELSHLSLLLACAVYMYNGKHSQAISLLWKYLDKSEDRLSGSHYKNTMERISSLTSHSKQEEESGDGKHEDLDRVAAIFKEKQIGSCIVSLLQAVTAKENPRLCKHLYATALDHDNSQLGHGASLARQGMVRLLWDSKKEADQKLLKALLEDAKEKKDAATADLLKKLSGEKFAH